MASAPPVSFPVQRSRFYGGFLATAWLAGVLVSIDGYLVADGVGWRQYFPLLLVTVLGATTFWTWRKSPIGLLQWDGQRWFLKTPSLTLSGSAAVHLDFQFFLLLCMKAESGRVVWLAVDRPSTSASWVALRRALFSRTFAEALSNPDKQTDQVRTDP